MKTKTLLLLSVLTVVSFWGSAKGIGDLEDEGLQIINLRRNFVPSIITDITPESDIETTFDSNIGIVYITIKSNVGATVIKRIVDTAVRDNLQLSISNLPVDAYIIEFRDSKGRVLKTEKFSIQ